MRDHVAVVIVYDCRPFDEKGTLEFSFSGQGARGLEKIHKRRSEPLRALTVSEDCHILCGYHRFIHLNIYVAYTRSRETIVRAVINMSLMCSEDTA
jgi:hypothetical protein